MVKTKGESVRNIMRLSTVFAAACFAFTTPALASVLDDVKARGTLRCGVNAGLQGFAKKDDTGAWAGFDVDYCKAIAAAVLGDASKVEYIPATVQDRFDKLVNGDIDILARNTTWTIERETKWPIRFAGASYHDGQGFLMKALMGVTSVYNMGSSAICMVSGTTSEANVADFFQEKELAYTALSFSTSDEAIKAFNEGKCDAYTADQSQLYAVRLQLTKPDDHIILPEVISKEPLGPAVRMGDDQWYSIARWTLFALINAEELDVRAATVEDESKNSKKPTVRRLLGVDADFGGMLGLDKTWAARAISAVGNYGEIFDRNLGEGSALGIERGLNAQWDKGGILYAPPMR
jgi:general L-amino acid transport system substrate-binding protein